MTWAFLAGIVTAILLMVVSLWPDRHDPESGEHPADPQESKQDDP